MRGDELRVKCVALLAMAVVCAGSAAVAEELDPPLVDMKEHKDPGGFISVELPRHATVRGPSENDPNNLQIWAVNLKEDKAAPPQIYVYADRRSGYARASLYAHIADRNRNGTRVKGSLEKGKGVWSEMRHMPGKVYIRYRFVEHGGEVFQIWVTAQESRYPGLAEHIDTIAATFKVLKKPKDELPEGFKPAKFKGREVWSDAKGADNKRVMKAFEKAWKLAAGMFPRAPFVEAPPRVIICQSDDAYAVLYDWKRTKQAPRYSFVDRSLRAVVVRLSARKQKEFYPTIQRDAARLCIRNYFGGSPPLWVEEGLRVYVSQGVESNGKFHQTNYRMVDKARESAAKLDMGLNDLFVMPKPTTGARNDVDRTLWSLHWYFRHGPDVKKYGKTYDRCIDALRQSGDVDEADAVWAGADLAKIDADYRAWVKEWGKK